MMKKCDRRREAGREGGVVCCSASWLSKPARHLCCLVRVQG